jgi:hypothetical protein
MGQGAPTGYEAADCASTICEMVGNCWWVILGVPLPDSGEFEPARASGARNGDPAGYPQIHLKHIFEKTCVRGRYGLAISGLQERGLVSMVGSGSI